ncbi:PREDICTED: FAD synthetase 2, chloroplastic-like isoform X2 [Nelumbo nucifera]|uniref:FAD synthase n=1 Tax=Nelumbo nucifera TaxID=4432 RepID=A0A1U8AM17_NELNU|nr:PREDICTED: FAD synthetase 2, chloroplastic-like isoform X2 [Nelumbo nucifera]
MANGCRISQHLTGCNLGFYSRIQICSYVAGRNSISSSLRPFGRICEKHLQRCLSSSHASGDNIGCLQARVPGEASSLSDYFRAPIVAKCDRKRVLSTWAPHCGNVAPAELYVEFSTVRHLTPRQFVEKLAKEFGVRGVVAGENYRFGYKAAGDASELVRLCEEYGMRAYIVSSVMDKNQCFTNKGSIDSNDKGQVSSTRVRLALAEGNMKYVSDLLGRKHRLMLQVTDQEGFVIRGKRITALRSCLLNLPPKDGLYESCSLVVNDDILVPCRTIIDTTHIQVESDEKSAWTKVLQDCRFVGIEFE